MRVFVDLRAIASLDLDQLQKTFDQHVTIDDIDELTAAVSQSGIVNLAASATSVPFDFGSVTAASLLVIVAFQDVQVQLDSNTAPLVDVVPTPQVESALVTSVYQRCQQPGLVVWRGKVTSLFLSNPNTTTAAQAFVGIVGNAQ